MAKYHDITTVQKWIKGESTLEASFIGGMSSAFLWPISADRNEAPLWWSYARDNWLTAFVKAQGNNILSGAVSTMTAKVKATSWYVEGPKVLAEAYRDSLLYKSDFGAGWGSLCSKFAQGFFNRDGGGLIEHQRASGTDYTGPALAFAHLDESKCLYSNDPNWPVYYQDGESLRKLHRSQVSRIVDMPSGEELNKGYGFCAVSRSIATAFILMDIVRYKRERLSDLPPAGIMFLSNITDIGWEDVINKYDTRRRNDGMLVWKDLMVVCGVDPKYPVSGELLEMSRLPEHYDEKVATEISVYTFALAFRTDPRDFWPVSSGPLGTATEATIQHRKSKAKGIGVVYTDMERIFNGPFALPQVLKFRFDYQDDEDDRMAAEIANQRLKNIRLMWESSPNRGTLEGELNEGIISTKEARQLLLYSRIVPSHILGMEEEEVQAYDIRMAQMYGPWVRAYNDGYTRSMGY